MGCKLAGSFGEGEVLSSIKIIIYQIIIIKFINKFYLYNLELFKIVKTRI